MDDTGLLPAVLIQIEAHRMDWLLGTRRTDSPETPVHRWAYNAFKGVVMPDTPYPQAPIQTVQERRTSTTNAAASILKTPGTVTSIKTKNVKFHKSVQGRTNRFSKSGLPQEFPGKFPSPWVEKSDECDGIDTDKGDHEASPLGVEKDRRAASGIMNPLKKLSLQLNPGHSTKSHFANDSDRTKADKKSIETLHWDVDQGFEDVLASISKNNTYLQRLIDEMQDSCNDVEETFVTAPVDQNSSDMTINLDEPRSRSGQYWKAKFAEFSDLTAKVKKEQNHMEQALTHLRKEVEMRSNRIDENWKDKYEVLKEEFDRQRQSLRNSSQTKELRELRKQVRDLQSIANERDVLKARLTLADSNVADLQQKLSDRAAVMTTRRAVADTKADEASHEIFRPLDPLKHTPMARSDFAMITSIKQDVMHFPHSATSRRLALASAKLTGKTEQAPTTMPTQGSGEASDAAQVQAEVASTVKLEGRRLRHGRSRSRTTNLITKQDFDGLPVPTEEEIVPAVGKTSTASSMQPASSYNAKAETQTQAQAQQENKDAVNLTRPKLAQDSPRPLFATIDLNQRGIPPSSTHLQKTEKQAKSSKLEEAQRRIDARKADRERQKTRTMATMQRATIRG